MPDQLDMPEKAKLIEDGINQMVADGDRLAADLGGHVTTREITDALI